MIIVADKDIPFIKQYFADSNELILKPGRKITREDVKDADILLVRSITPVNQALLSGSRVKFVGSVTAGSDHVDTAWLKEARIPFFNTAGFNAPSVADYVVSVLAALHKGKICELPKKVAIVGVGRVGRLVAEQLKKLGMELIFCDPIRADTDVGFMSIELEMIKDVDLISLHVPLTFPPDIYSTYHCIGEAFLKRQKEGTILLNASRGAVIDSKALMQFGRHLHWCFDVFEHEPKINLNILQKTTIATPHIAGYSVQSKMRGIDLIYQELLNQQLLNKNTQKHTNELPRKTFEFSGENLDWQDIVLGIFNPSLLSAMMKPILFAEEDEHGVARSFDHMRSEFNYRYELASCDVKTHPNAIDDDNQKILEALGVTT